MTASTLSARFSRTRGIPVQGEFVAPDAGICLREKPTVHTVLAESSGGLGWHSLGGSKEQDYQLTWRHKGPSALLEGQVIMEAWVKGVNPKGNSTNPSNWDFGSSFFFAGTVVTTIGYGNLAPSTEAGQVFCVFYALVGIPLNVIFLNHLGTGLRGHLTTLERWEDQPRRSQVLQVLGLALFLTLGTLVILVFPPMVFSHVEGWSFSEGFYFAFITLSTIGFGDYVVGTDPSKHYISVYRSLAAIWILLGLAWLALVLPLGPLLLHRCSQLWLLSRGLRLKEGGVPEANGLPRPQKIPTSA
ncbi:PREDICTED: potassium channel subfamily K member 16 [Myotis brandtii]|nr:PREDICTED: potassium channel subfamily K member 16 [Myotis brandtii]